MALIREMIEVTRRRSHATRIVCLTAGRDPSLTMSRLRSFLYRSPRFTADCRMDFIHGDLVFLGTCSNLSETGLRGVFDDFIAPGTEGLLTLYHADRRLAVKATVYSVRDGEARLRFSPKSDAERAAVSDLLKLFAVRPASR